MSSTFQSGQNRGYFRLRKETSFLSSYPWLRWCCYVRVISFDVSRYIEMNGLVSTTIVLIATFIGNATSIRCYKCIGMEGKQSCHDDKNNYVLCQGHHLCGYIEARPHAARVSGKFYQDCFREERCEALENNTDPNYTGQCCRTDFCNNINPSGARSVTIQKPLLTFSMAPIFISALSSLLNQIV